MVNFRLQPTQYPLVLDGPTPEDVAIPGQKQLGVPSAA